MREMRANERNANKIEKKRDDGVGGRKKAVNVSIGQVAESRERNSEENERTAGEHKTFKASIKLSHIFPLQRNI